MPGTRHLRPLIVAALAVACAPVDDDASDDTDTVDDTDHTGTVDTLPVQDTGVDAYAWGLPDWAPRPTVPDDNPMTADKVDLGRHLFYDRRLSGNGTLSCADCHDQALGFADGRDVATGSTGGHTARNSMGLLNVAYMTSLNWANPTTLSLEQQILIPLFGETPVELGLTGHEAEVYARFEEDPDLRARFAAAYPERDPEGTLVTTETVVHALASFVRSMVSFDTPVDRAAYGGTTTLDPEVTAGMDLFFSERLECHHCHGSWNFSLTTTHAGDPFPQLGFQNNGLYDIDGQGAYPPDNTGLFEFTHDRADMGRFRPPTLRNVALTAPYMHDGSIATLAEVIDFYAEGGRVIQEGPYAGDSRNSPLKSTFVNGFQLTATEKRALVAFLEALTDPTFTADPRFSDPYAE